MHLENWPLFSQFKVSFPTGMQLNLGSFSIFSTRFIDPAWGFAMGWNYAIQWLTILPFELVAAGLTVRYWNDSLHGAIFITIFYIVILGINLVGVRGYGEVEFILSILK